MSLIADINLQGLTLQNILIGIVIIAAAVALVYLALRVFEIRIPEWVVQVFWIVGAAFFVILAIKLVFSMW